MVDYPIAGYPTVFHPREGYLNGGYAMRRCPLLGQAHASSLT